MKKRILLVAALASAALVAVAPAANAGDGHHGGGGLCVPVAPILSYEALGVVAPALGVAVTSESLGGREGTVNVYTDERWAFGPSRVTYIGTPSGFGVDSGELRDGSIGLTAYNVVGGALACVLPFSFLP